MTDNKTRIFDPQAEIKELKDRVEILERALILSASCFQRREIIFNEAYDTFGDLLTLLSNIKEPTND